ncbi:MAG: hypothetical protein WAT39_16995 [Planctomycetota bacterium]
MQSGALAQCTNPLLSGGGYPGVNGEVRDACSWDPDGPGPATPRVVIVGHFTIAGDAQARHVAAWDPATSRWSSLGAQFSSHHSIPLEVNAVVAMPNGELVVGGRFWGASGNLARWDGSTWAVAGGGVSHVNFDKVSVFSLLALPNGDLIVGGFFTWAGTVPASNIARWNGTTWSAMSTGFYSTLTPSGVYALGALATGEVVAAGFLYNVGVGGVRFLSRWTGASWMPMGTPPNGAVSALTTLANGDFVAGGSFTTIGGVAAPGIARWNGTSWSSLGGGVNGSVLALTTLTTGELVAAGYFTTASLEVSAAHVQMEFSGTPCGAYLSATAMLDGQSVRFGVGPFASTFGWLVFGLQPAQVTLPLAPSCPLLVVPEVMVAASGMAWTTLPLAHLGPLDLYVQGVMLAPASPWLPNGALHSSERATLHVR